MNYVEVSNWLKETIPGIIMLGAMGSLFAGLLLWISAKSLKLLLKFNKYIWFNVFGENLAKIGISYMRYYYRLRATVFQLFNKDRQLPLIVYHQRLIANRNLSVFNFIIFTLAAYLMFLFVGTNFPKTTAFFVTVSILSGHDSILYTIWTNKIDKYFYGNEETISEATYESKEAVITQSLISILAFSKNKMD